MPRLTLRKRPSLRLNTCLALAAATPLPLSLQAMAPAMTLPAPAAARPAYTLSPQRRALLETIRYAEGTWKNGSADGYRTLYGGGLFTGLDRHPEITVHGGYVSAAAGAYQFLPGTWQQTARQLGLRTFQPHNQDQAALHLVKRRGALQLFDQRGLTRDVLARLAPEWASLPTLEGHSHYGQPVKSYGELVSFYQQALRRQQQG